MWPAVYYKDCTIFGLCYTNMLVETYVHFTSFFLFITNGVHFSWHHILKGKMLDGKQNKQLDHLLYILLHNAILFYKAKHWHQKYGLKGPDLEVQEREKMQVCGATFTLNDIQKVTSGHLYLIYSQSCPKHQHIVDIETYTCD